MDAIRLPHPPESLRLDKWLFFSRLFRTRAQAADMCASRHLRMDGRVIDKAHAAVRIGSVISFPRGGRVIVVKVLGLGERRGPAGSGMSLYEDLSPAPKAAISPVELTL
jgi:ribosome-associated heat shock protein Hsp15